MRTMVSVTCDRTKWYVYDVGPEELGQLVDEHGKTAVCIMEWGECKDTAVGSRADERIAILKILNMDNQ